MTTALDDTSRLPYLRRVYSLFSLNVLVTVLTSFIVSEVGTPQEAHLGKYVVSVTPAVAFALEHHWFLALASLGLVIAAGFSRKREQGGSMGVPILFLYAVVTGVLIAPLIALANFKAGHGLTYFAHPVRDAGLLTAGAFTTLSAYAIQTRKDFSYLRAGLFVGLIVLILALFLNLVLGSEVFGLALASVTVLLFVGFILFDTSQMIHGEQDEVDMALNLYLDVLNLFTALLRIGMAGSKD